MTATQLCPECHGDGTVLDRRDVEHVCEACGGTGEYDPTDPRWQP